MFGRNHKVRSKKSNLLFTKFASKGLKLNFYNSLEYGQFYFDMDSSYTIKGETYNGVASYNVFAIRELGRGRVATNAIPHEIVHTFQNYVFFTISSLYQKTFDKFVNKSNVYKKVSRFINFDYQPIFFTAIYNAQPTPKYYKNNLEFEAEHFSDRRFIER